MNETEMFFCPPRAYVEKDWPDIKPVTRYTVRSKDPGEINTKRMEGGTIKEQCGWNEGVMVQETILEEVTFEQGGGGCDFI